jgi:beta-lactamase regulating signal transducer with metallopeptidase domain
MTDLLNSLWQGTTITALIWLMLKALPRLSSATRYGIWWITLLAVALLSLRTLLPAGTSQAAPRDPITTKSDGQITLIPAAPHARDSSILILRSSPPPHAPLTTEYSTSSRLQPLHLPAHLITRLIVAAWLILSVTLLTRLAYSYHALRRLKRTAVEPSESLRSRFTHIAGSARIHRSTQLLISPEIPSPLALGFLSPVILIPTSMADEFSTQEFNHVVLHELAHLSRYDDWTNLFQQILVALLPIQPALFWIARHLNLEREAACDDRVVAVTAAPKPYAASLTRIAELALWARHGSLACPALATGVARSRSHLFRRINRLLDRRSNKSPRIATVPFLMGVIVVAVLLSLSFSAPQLIALTDNSAGPQAPSSNTIPIIPIAKVPDMPTTILPSIPGSQIQSIPALPGEKLSADLDLGNVHINTWDKNQVQIKVTQTGPDIEKFLRHHQISIGRQDHQVSLTSSGDPGTNGLKIDIEYEITIPAKFDVQLKNHAGNASLAGLNGTLSAEIEAGNIDANSCAGSLNASAQSGNIALHAITAVTHAVTTNGNIDAADCQGPLTLSAINGNINLARNTADVNASAINGNFDSAVASGSIRAATRAGNIDIRKFTGPALSAHANMGNVSADIETTPKSDSSLTADMGNVNLDLLSSAAVHLKFATSMGDVHSQFPPGSVNGGGPELDLSSHMGNITVRKK